MMLVTKTMNDLKFSQKILFSSFDIISAKFLHCNFRFFNSSYLNSLPFPATNLQLQFVRPSHFPKLPSGKPLIFGAIRKANSSPAFSRNYPDRKRWRISAASTKSPDEIAVVRRNKKMISNDDNDKKDRKDSNESNDRAIVHEKVDEWMRESVTEIVKNLRGAPLLVQVYEGGETKTLAVEEETWPAVMENWGKKEVPVPEGVIFVEM